MNKMIYAAAFGLMFLLSGCLAPGANAQETTLNVKVIASDTSTPLAIYFFALESDEQFKRLDYSELMKKKASRLNGDIVTQSKKILLPGHMEKRRINVANNIHYYAVVAGFKNVDDNDNWRYIQEIVPGRKNDITLILSQEYMRKVRR